MARAWTNLRQEARKLRQGDRARIGSKPILIPCQILVGKIVCPPSLENFDIYRINTD